MKSPQHLGRRAFLQAVAAGLGPAKADSRGDARRLVVMTGYPQEVISRYVDAFARARPGARVDILWHSGDDARDLLLGPGKGQIDVYWSPSVRTFHELAAQGAFAVLNIDRSGLPGRIGKQVISDPDGRFEATEIAGYGMVINPDYLRRTGLPEPRQWADLADPAFAGHVTMPVPGRIGFAPTITEIILQAEGWRAGWALLSRIAANAVLRAARGDEAMGMVARGEKGVGLTIDFFAAQAIARGAPLRFVYPKANAFEPAHIAVPAQAPNAADALAYVTFVLSPEGQRLLVDPDLRRLAVRPSVYADAPADYFNPWSSAFAAELSFDDGLFVRRRDLDNALFDCMIFEPRDRLAALWARKRTLEGKAGLPATAKTLLAEAETRMTAVVIEEPDADHLAAAFAGRRRDGGEMAPPAAAALQAWAAAVAANLDAADMALRQLEAL